MSRKVPTPCIGICSTVFGDVVCRGCRRFIHEVIDWNRYNEPQKRLVWQRLDGLTGQVLARYFRIDDAALLRSQLRHYRMPFRAELSPWMDLYALLKAAAGQEPDLAGFGVTPLVEVSSLRELRDQVNDEIHALAQAYYEIHFLRAEQQKSR